MGSKHRGCSTCTYEDMANCDYPCDVCYEKSNGKPDEYRRAAIEEHNEIATAIKTLERYGFKVTLESKEV